MTADRITALEDALTLAANRLHRVALDFDTGTEPFYRISEWGDEARIALAASRAAHDCHQQDLVTADRVRVKPLVWEEWEYGDGQAQSIFGAYHVWPGYFRPPKATGIASSDPKAAAQADYEARILAALDLTPAPAVEPVAWRHRYTIPAKDGTRIEQWGLSVTRMWPDDLPLYAHPPAQTAQDAARVLLDSHTIKTMMDAGKALDLAETLRAIGGDA